MVLRTASGGNVPGRFGARAIYGGTGGSAPTGDKTAVFFGDSYTAGVQSSDNAHRFSSLVSAALGLVETNLGSTGTILQDSTYITSAPGVAQAGNGYGRFNTSLLGAGKRDQIFIGYGFNDARYTGGTGTDGSGTSVTLAAYNTEYRQLLNGLICQGISPAKITLISTYWMADAGLASGTTGFVMTTNLGSTAAARAQLIAFRDAVATIASEYGTPYVDAYSAMQTAGAGIMGPDNIHPLDAGHAVLATAVLARAPNNTKPVPTTVAAVRGGAGVMNVTWTAPTPPNGTTITSYTVEYGLKSATSVGSRFIFTGTISPTVTNQSFTGLADGWYVARVKANYSDATSSPWAWYTTGANIDSRTTDTVVQFSDLSLATPGVNLETVAPWAKSPISTASATIANNAALLGTNQSDIVGGRTASQTMIYSVANQTFPGTGKLFNEQVWTYYSSSGGNANYSVMLLGSNATAANGILILYNDVSFRVFKLTAGALAAATGTTTATVSLFPGFDYLVRLEVSAGAQTMYLNNAAVGTATEPTGGAWGTESGLRIANTTFLATDTTCNHVKSVKIGTTV